MFAVYFIAVSVRHSGGDANPRESLSPEDARTRPWVPRGVQRGGSGQGQEPLRAGRVVPHRVYLAPRPRREPKVRCNVFFFGGFSPL